MFGRKKKEALPVETTPNAMPKETKTLEKKLEPVLISGEYILEQKNRLQQEELETTAALNTIHSSFEIVQEQSHEISESMNVFREQFGEVEDITGRFEQIIERMNVTAEETHASIENVRTSSQTVEETIGALE